MKDEDQPPLADEQQPAAQTAAPVGKSHVAGGAATGNWSAASACRSFHWVTRSTRLPSIRRRGRAGAERCAIERANIVLAPLSINGMKLID